jgi:hypothetical protein
MKQDVAGGRGSPEEATMQACPGCSLAIDDKADFCSTCGWKRGEKDGAGTAAQTPAAAAQPVDEPRIGRPPGSTGRPSRPGFDLWSLPKWLVAIPLVTVVIAGHVAFPHLPWNKYAVRFGNTWETDGLRLAAGVCVLLAGIGVTILLAWLLGRKR